VIDDHGPAVIRFSLTNLLEMGRDDQWLRLHQNIVDGSQPAKGDRQISGKLFSLQGSCLSTQQHHSGIKRQPRMSIEVFQSKCLTEMMAGLCQQPYCRIDFRALSMSQSQQQLACKQRTTGREMGTGYN